MRHLKRMGQTGAIVIARGRHAHLRLVLEAPERLAVNDPVAIALERSPQPTFGRRPTPEGRVGARGRGRELRLLTGADTRRKRRCHRAARMLVACHHRLIGHQSDSDSGAVALSTPVSKLSQSACSGRPRYTSFRTGGMTPASAKARRCAQVLVGLMAVAALTAPAANAWQPEAASYGVGSQLNQAVKMSDGTVLRANVLYPTDPKTGTAAPGPFPVILTQTPYGKDNSEFSALGAGQSNYLVQRGYINVIADVRGTGGSQGEWGLFDPVQGHDGATLVNWAAGLPHSTGSVGLLGPSYLGINQFE